MFKVSLRELIAHKIRLVLTCVAIITGVSFLAGTFVLGDTMRDGFAKVFSQANENVDVVVRSANNEDMNGFAQRQNVELSLQPTLEAVDGVAEVQPEVVGLAQITGADGKPIGGSGPPTLASAWADSATNPYQVAEGRAPEATNEVVIDRSSARLGKLSVGDTTVVRTPNPLDVTIVGIVTFGTADSVGGVTYTGFTFDQAQQLFIGNTTQATDFVVRGEDGLTQTQVLDGIRPALPPGVEAITADELTKEQQTDINASFLDAFDFFLKIFSVIALIVAAFTIYNIFSIVLAQRTRESALLRAIGASRAQVLGSMTLEALMIGVISSILGIIGGLVLASLAKAGLDAANFGLPKGTVKIEPDSIIIAFVVGVVVTLIAGVLPSRRASKVPPLAAIRDVAVDRGNASIARQIAGPILATIGIGLVLWGAVADVSNALGRVGLGALVCIIAMVVLGPVAARPGGSVIGAPIARFRHLPGRLARRNAVRSPKRTASTAAALMVGITIVTLFSLFGSSLKASFDDLIGENFSGDLVITSLSFGAPGFPPELAEEAAALPEVEHAAGWSYGVANVGGEGLLLVASEPEPYGSIVDPTITAGSIIDLEDGQMAISDSLAEQRGWTMGQTVPVAYLDGTTGELTIAATFARPELIGADAFVPLSTWAPHATALSDREVFVTLAEGVSIEEGKAALQPVADRYGGTEVRDRDEYVALFSGQIDVMILIVNALLVLSIFIATIGIIATLALSVFERTRELGLLRAVGETRAQMRSMVRWESTIIAVFGTFGGLLVGVFLGWGVMRAFATDQGFGVFELPYGQLVFILVVGGVLGILAGIVPAWWAARRNILQSIAADG